MGKINILGFDVANMIAAGEVVDRPASVVKELLENALDAGGDSVTIEIRRGGITFIRVSDNGCGMDTEDLPVALLRHATSKIKDAADLDGISTLGFRGEALAAISSVSKIKIYSKVRGNSLGALLEAEGGEIVSIVDTGCADGTTVIVEDLFFNVPARRKFLKKDSTEAIAISAVVEKIALSRPDVSIKYISDGEIKFMTSGKGDLSETVWALYGRDIAKRSLKVDREEGGIRVSGFVSEPDLYRSNRNMENFFINGRYIKSKTASAAIEQAYSSKIPHDKFPFCVLNIELNPSAVDVNVHPAKLEVKFANEKLIFDAVYYAVLSALEAEAKRPELSLPKTAREFSNAFLPMDTRNKRAEQIGLQKFAPAESAPTKVTAPQPTRTQTAPQLSVAEKYRGVSDGYKIPKGSSTPKETTHEAPPIENRLPYSEMISLHTEAIRKTEPEVTKKTETPAYSPAPQISIPVPEAKDITPPRKQAGTVYVPDEITAESIPEYILIGEAWNCYVIVQIDDRLLMIDKHAAHERIIFDELCRNMQAALRGKKSEGRLLLTPYDVDLTSAEADVLEDYRDKITALGFDYTTKENGVSSYIARIVQIPEALDTASAVELFSTLASKLSDMTASVESAAETFFQTRLWQASCKAAIKGGRIYDMGHIRWICDRLLCNPDQNGSVIRTCPHGRPVAFEIKKSSVDRQFQRLT